jgi:methionyl-tRNA synthetase
VHRCRQGTVPALGARRAAPAPAADPAPGTRLAACAPAAADPAAGSRLAAACEQAPRRVAAALCDADFRAATAALWDVVAEANRYAERAEPWRLARAERDGDASAGVLLDQSLALLFQACSVLGRELAPFLPNLAGRIQAACGGGDGPLPAPAPVFPRLAPSLG